MKLWLVILALTACIILSFNTYLLFKPRSDQVSGDTLIHLVYARNSVDGRPFEYNDGQPSRALTSPLWNAGLALAGSLTGTADDNEAFLRTFRILAIITLAGALAMCWRLSLRLGADTAWAAAGITILLTNPSMYYWTVANPMETAGAMLFALMAIWWASCARTVGWWAGGGALAAAGFLMRPELAIFWGLAGGAAFLVRTPKPWVGAAAFGATAAAGIAAWAGYLMWSGLAVLPNAGSARRIMLFLDDAAPMPVLGIPWSPDAILFSLMFIPLIMGTVAGIRSADAGQRAAAFAALLILAFALLFFTFYFPTTWQGRYLLPVIFAITPTGVAGLRKALPRFSPVATSLCGAVYCLALAAILIRPLAAYADAPRQRALPRPAFLTPPPDSRSILCQEIQSAYFYPRLFHVCTEGLIGLEVLEARKRDLTTMDFLHEQRPDLIGTGRYPLRDPDHAAEAIREAAREKRNLALPGVTLIYLGEMAGCGEVFRAAWEKPPAKP